MAKKDAFDSDKKAKEIRANFDRYADEWAPIRKSADDDMQAVIGEPWPENDVRLREDAMRPVVVNDELHQFFNQVINDARMNPRAVKFSATPELPNPQADDTARFYNDYWREVEYRSNAVHHYLTALQNAIHRSFGWTRVTTRYESPRSQYHDCWIEGVPNPNMIVPDPDSLLPDSSDMKGLFAYHEIGTKEFKKKFPDAQCRDFGPDIRKMYPRWVKNARTIQLAEFWEVEQVVKRLMVVQRESALKNLKPEILHDPTHAIHQHLTRQAGPVGVFPDELQEIPEDDDILDVREIEDRKVVQYLTNGVEILKVKPWLGKYIPFASCFGMVLYLDREGQMQRHILSMTRLAKQPYLAMCYLAATELEVIGMMPKFPYFVAKGTLTPKMWNLLEQSLHEPIAGIEYNDFPENRNPGAGPAPAPIRQPYEPPLMAIQAAKESQRRSIQAAMGITPLPTPAQQNNETTGEALRLRSDSGQKGSFHYTDSYNAMIRHIGVIGEDLIDKVVDTARTVATLDALKRPKQIRVNDPNDPNSVSTHGDHIVTVDSAPAESSARESAKDFIQAILQAPTLSESLQNPVAAKIFALGIRLQNVGIIGDEVADLLDPPPNAKVTPQMLQGQLAKAQTVIQQMQQQIQQLQQEKAAKITELQGKAQLQDQKLQADAADSDKDRAVKLDIAAMQAKIETLGLFMEELKRLGGYKESLQQQLHDSAHKVADRTHEIAKAALQHTSDVIQNEQVHGHTLEQQQQAAALAPEPAEPPATPNP